MKKVSVTNMAIGAVVGVAATAIGTKLISSNKKSMKKTLSKAAHTMSDVVDSVALMMK
ncbi:MAG: hypothetical protein IJC83_05725 [Oscillospiraceae bacterium]|nr:hypothetical protein [Oscillospiraceae bacterium]